MIDAHTSHHDVSPWKVILGFLAIYLIWGSTYLAIRFAIESIPALLSAGVRFIFGGAMLYTYARLRGGVLATSVQMRNTSYTGLLLVLGGTGTVTWAEQWVPSGLAALMIAAVPFWMTLIEWLRPQGVRPSAGVVAGLIIGFMGIVLLIGPIQLASEGHIGLVAAFALLFATLSWATGSIVSRHVDLPESKLISVGLQMMAGGVGLNVLAAATGEFSQLDIAAVSSKSLLGLAYLTVIGSLAFAAYVWLLKVSTPAKVSTYAFVNPVVAVFLGWLLGGEALNGRILFAAAIIISAVTVITITRGKKSRVTASDQQESEQANRISISESN